MGPHYTTFAASRKFIILSNKRLSFKKKSFFNFKFIRFKLKGNCFTELCCFLPNIISKLDIEGKFLNLIERCTKSTVNITLNNEACFQSTIQNEPRLIIPTTLPTTGGFSQ